VWEPANADDKLSQGDLLVDVNFPKVRLALDVTRALPKPAAILEVQTRPALVVSQDCIIDKEHVKHIALAPIRPEGGLTPEDIEAIRSPEPPLEGGEEAGGYVYDYFGLDDLVGVFEAPPRGIVVADLKVIQSFEGPREDFVGKRVARMSVDSVRLLRIDLASFWGRPSDEHVAALQALGLPPGLTPEAQ
jgi:hypothetical protein